MRAAVEAGGAAFVQALGLCCEIRGQQDWAVHNLQLTSGIQQQRKSHFKQQPSSHLKVKTHLWTLSDSDVDREWR